MYEHVFHFFGLRENPFGISPDPRFYFSTPAYDAALAELILGVNAPQGLIVLTGEAGTGKTTLLNHFLNCLQERRRSNSYVFHPRLKSVELFDCILRDFGVPCESRHKADLLVALRDWLIRRRAMDDSPVVVIDEAQAISVQTLDRLRLLLNLETAGNKLLRIVLAGQPGLEEKLRRPELRRLRRRVTFHCRLEPFSLEETLQYVKSRLFSTGATSTELFAQESLEATHRYARGIPRTVNLLCEQALIAGYAERVKIVSPDIIRRVAEDFDLTPRSVAGEEREISARFRGLVLVRPEGSSTGVVPDTVAVESAKAETRMGETAPAIRQIKPGRLQEVEPTLIVEEPKFLAPPAANSVNHPVVAAMSTPFQVTRTIAKPLEHPERVRPKELQIASQRTRLGERFVEYWKESIDILLRDCKEFMDEHAALVNQRVAAVVSALSRVMRSISKPEEPEQARPKKLRIAWQRTRMGERLVGYGRELQAIIARDWKRLMNEHTAVTQVNQPMAAPGPMMSRLAQTIVKPEDPEQVRPKKLRIAWQRAHLGERFVGYGQEVRTVLVRTWKKLMNERAAATPVNQPAASTPPILRREMGTIGMLPEDLEPVRPNKSPIDWQRTRFGEWLKLCWKEVRATFARDWKPLTSERAAASVIQPANTAGPLLSRLGRTISIPRAHKGHVRPAKLSIDWQRTRLGEWFVQYWQEVRIGFVRDWKRWMNERAAATPVTQPVVSVPPTLRREMRAIATSDEAPEHLRPTKLPIGWQRPQSRQRSVSYWKEARASFVRDWTRFMNERAALNSANQPVAVATAVPTLPEVVPTMAKPPEDPKLVRSTGLQIGWQRNRLRERLVRYWKEVRISFVRDWKQFVHSENPNGRRPVSFH